MDKLIIDLSNCVVADVSQTVGPYLRHYMQRRGGSPSGLGISLHGFGLIAFDAGDVGRLDSSIPALERMKSFLRFTIWGLPLPDDVQARLTLDFLTYVPREEVVYFRNEDPRLTVVGELSVQMPNLKALDLRRVPLHAAFSTLGPQGGSHIQGRFPLSLQHIFLAQLIVNGFDWIPFIAFLSHRASLGNELDSVRIDGPYHMCVPVNQTVRGLVRRLDIDKACLDSWCPFGTCLYT